MKRDIENREDLLLLMQKFYEKLLGDTSISYIFTDIAKIDIFHHLPVLVDFWDMVLFQSDNYRKNLLDLHIKLHHMSPLKKEHFETWICYFNTTIDDLYEGEKAFLCKAKGSEHCDSYTGKDCSIEMIKCWS